MSYRNKKLLDAARDRPCVLCESQGTTIAAHCNRVDLGHGVGIKAPDYYTAFVCQPCHDKIDGRSGKLTKQERYDLWLLAFVRTVEVWFQNGIVRVS